MTNVKVYISLEKVGDGEGMERGMVRGGGGEKEKKNRREGETEEMPCIPLSGQREPQREGRGGEETTDMREIQEKEEKRERRKRGVDRS